MYVLKSRKFNPPSTLICSVKVSDTGIPNFTAVNAMRFVLLMSTAVCVVAALESEYVVEATCGPPSFVGVADVCADDAVIAMIKLHGKRKAGRQITHSSGRI